MTRKVRCVLMTIGSGPVAMNSYITLKRLVDLRCVVLSRKRSEETVFGAVRKYGIWYTAQSAISVLTNKLRRQSVTANLIERDGIRHTVWADNGDEKRIITLLRELEVELVLICGFQHILRKEFLETAGYCFNVHPSLLPDHRGPDPIAWGLLCHDKFFGITIHEVNELIDEGDILAQAKIDVPALPLQALVESRLSNLVPGLLEKLVDDVIAGQLKPRVQGEGTYMPSPSLANRKLLKEKRLDR